MGYTIQNHIILRRERVFFILELRIFFFKIIFQFVFFLYPNIIKTLVDCSRLPPPIASRHWSPTVTVDCRRSPTVGRRRLSPIVGRRSPPVVGRRLPPAVGSRLPPTTTCHLSPSITVRCSFYDSSFEINET